jgi:hypothetical protein
MGANPRVAQLEPLLPRPPQQQLDVVRPERVIVVERRDPQPACRRTASL